MAMAVIVLLSIALLLAFCCNFDLRKLTANYLLPMLTHFMPQRKQQKRKQQQQQEQLQQQEQQQLQQSQEQQQQLHQHVQIESTPAPSPAPAAIQQSPPILQQPQEQIQQTIQQQDNNKNHQLQLQQQQNYINYNHNNNNNHNEKNNNGKQINFIYNYNYISERVQKSLGDDFYHTTEIKSSTTTTTTTTTKIVKTSPKSIWDIPGPHPIPLLGTKWIFFLHFRKYKMSSLHEVYADLNRQYGDIVLEVMPSGVPIVHLFNRRDLEKVLKYPSKYPFRPPTEIVVMYRQSRPDRYASVGITNEQGPTWQKLRSSLTSYITSPRILQNFLPALNFVCDDFIELLRLERDPITNEITNFEEIANLMGLEAVCTLMLGRRMGFLTKNQPDKIRSLAVAVKQLFISQRDSYYGLGLWKYFPTKTYRKFAEAEEIIYDVISEMVEKALEDHRNSSSCGSIDGNDDNAAALRSVFLHILDIKDLDIRDKKSAIIDFIAAGIETLANTLLFVLSSVTSDDNVMKRILDEFREYRQTHILQEAFTNATYTKACIQESYRIRPTAFCLARILEEDMELSGYQIKAGTVVLCQNMIACHKDGNFSEARQFRPERWIDNGGNFTMNIEGSSIVVPFGIGKRTCPGKRFVEMEVVLLLAKLLLAFDVSFKKPLETEFEFLLAPKTPLTLILRDRID